MEAIIMARKPTGKITQNRAEVQQKNGDRQVFGISLRDPSIKFINAKLFCSF